MNKFRNNLKEMREQESGAAMVMALLIMLALLSIATVMTATAMVGLNKGKDIQEITASRQAADTALNHALMMANNPGPGQSIEKHVGIMNAVYGSPDANPSSATGDGKMQWRWYAERINTAYEGTQYNIIATGYKTSPNEQSAKSVKMQLDSFGATEARYTANGIIYSPTPIGSFTWAAFAMNSINVKDNVNINYYDSTLTPVGVPLTSLAQPTGAGNLATNGSMSITSTANTGQLAYFLAPNNDSIDATRCIGDTMKQCRFSNFQRFTYGMDTKHISDNVAAMCPNATYPDWKASVNGSVISPPADPNAPQCYGNIVFDADTSIASHYSTGNPAVMYAKGNITVNPGVEVNIPRSSGTGALALRIYSQNGTNFTMNRGTSADPTLFFGLVGGQNLNCNVGGTASTATGHKTTLYGSMVCANVVLEKDSTLWWDAQLSNVAHNGFLDNQKIWIPKEYQDIPNP